MPAMRRILFAGAIAAMISSSAVCVSAQEGPVTTTALINVQSKSAVPLNPEMLTLQVNGHATPVTGVRPLSANTAQVAILVDDGLRGNFANQLKDVAAFINALPPGMQVLVGYMRNGLVDVTTENKGFSTDHAAVANSLRITLSAPGISASPYFCLSEFVKHWPSNQPGPRFVLMLTNGVDPYNGSTSIMNQDSPYVQTAQEDAQRNGVAVYSIYYGDAGLRVGRGSFSGQSYLAQVAEATGAESFWQGTGNPVSLEPFLKAFDKDISESYTVSFMTDPGKKNDLARLKLKTSQPGVKLRVPEGVRPGVALE